MLLRFRLVRRGNDSLYSCHWAHNNSALAASLSLAQEPGTLQVAAQVSGGALLKWVDLGGPVPLGDPLSLPDWCELAWKRAVAVAHDWDTDMLLQQVTARLASKEE